ncbi:MAG: PD40 domain-containing protein [Pirellulales bacterium]|nr:PD40 domain-containing protein [Pirellulales bacterium]
MGRYGTSRCNGWVAAAVCTIVCLAVCSAAAQDSFNRRQLMVINADGTGLKVVASPPQKTIGSPQWSPDGEWIAYDAWSKSESNGGPSWIEIIRTDGTEAKRIGQGSMPSWSPDGTQIVCHTSEGQLGSIVVMNLDGSGRETIMNHWGSPRWSPIGDQIIAANMGPGLAVFDLATGDERIVLPRQSSAQGLSISPDGRRVCFGPRPGGLAVATFEEQAGEVTFQWLLREGSFTHSSWSPDGKRIVYDQRAPAHPKYGQLYVVNSDGSGPPDRLSGQYASIGNYDPDWSPDGAQIAFVSDATSSDSTPAHEVVPAR